MRKTSVYLTDEEAESLRRLAQATGRSQAELVRAGLRQLLLGAGLAPRHFHSLGKGQGGGAPYTPWEPDDLYAAVMGRE